MIEYFGATFGKSTHPTSVIREAGDGWERRKADQPTHIMVNPKTLSGFIGDGLKNSWLKVESGETIKYKGTGFEELDFFVHPTIPLDVIGVGRVTGQDLAKGLSYAQL